MQKLIKILQISLLCALVSCSSDDSKDIKDAVSVFKYSDQLKIDESLQNKEQKIPAQIANKSWVGSNKGAENSEIENFAFASKITQTNSINLGYSSGNEDKKVFKPVIVDGVIYVLDNKGHLIARNLETLKEIYKVKIFEKKDKVDFLNGKIYFNNGKIFATSGFNYVAALNAVDGQIIWSKKITSMAISTPVATKDQVFVITSDNRTYSLNAADGSINWIHKGVNKNTSILGAADPVLYKDYILSSYSSGEIYALSQKTGDAGWSQDLNFSKAINSDFILNDIDATPIVKNDVVYSIGNGGLMMAISLTSGEVIWNKSLASISDFWIAGDFIYLINNDNQLIALSTDKGGIKWHKDLSDGETNPKKKTIFNGLIMAGDNLILSSSKDQILIISPITGEILQKKNFGGEIDHTPVIVDQKLYLHILDSFTTDLVVVQ